MSDRRAALRIRLLVLVAALIAPAMLMPRHRVMAAEPVIRTPTGNTHWTRSSVQSLLRTIEHDRQARAHADRWTAEQTED
ncbi:hypothetical protein [Candidatus Poriferisodalis sp.]|uniref:hypothetical protein n=1 Tax=Candidatus Poriferisodalis sp. TaxID=3101277 RepID=UPI003B016B53